LRRPKLPTTKGGSAPEEEEEEEEEGEDEEEEDINLWQYFELELNLLTCNPVGNIRILSAFCQHYHCHSIQSLLIS
jgi:hypothetical protein